MRETPPPAAPAKGDEHRFPCDQCGGDLRFDPGGRPVVAYFDLTQRKPVLARRVNGTWQVGFVEPTRDEGPHVGLWILDDTTAHIAFYNESRQSLRYGETLLPVATETTSMGGLRARFGGVD